MLFSWNLGAVVIFLKGQPTLWLVMVAVTLGISILERALSRKTQFIHVRQVIWPLICLACIVVVTARLTGGFGLRSFGSDVFGGKKYIFLLGGILSYFALTARSIPVEKANLYVGLFLLGGVASFIGDLYPITPSGLRFIFMVFQPGSTVDAFEVGVTRLGGIGAAGFAVYCWMMARYGVRGIFISGRVWRMGLFFLAVILSFMGGFRSTFLMILMIFEFQCRWMN